MAIHKKRKKESIQKRRKRLSVDTVFDTNNSSYSTGSGSPRAKTAADKRNAGGY